MTEMVLICEMHRMEVELKHLEDTGKAMERDSEMLNMLATVSGARTRLKTMLAEAEAKKSEIENKHSESDRQKFHLIEYQQILQELESWVTETFNQLTTEVSLGSVAAIQEQISVNESMLQDLTRREEQLSELRGKCERVKGDQHIQSLATEMKNHLIFLSQTISETRLVIQNRLQQLQEILTNERIRLEAECQESKEGLRSSDEKKNIEHDVKEVISDPVVYQVIRRRSIKNVVIIDGQPVETEEVFEEPEDLLEEKDLITDPLRTTKVVRAIRRRIIKTVTMVDGKPVEKEEVIEEPEDVAEEFMEEKSKFLDSVYEPEASSYFTESSLHRLKTQNIAKEEFLDSAEEVQEPEATIRSQQIIRRLIKRTVIVNGKPFEIEELEDPIHVEDTIMQGAQPHSTDDESTGNKKISLQKIKMINLKDAPRVGHEAVENMSTSEITQTAAQFQTIDRSMIVTRNRIMKKIVIIDGNPVETDEVVEEPVDSTIESLPHISSDSIIKENTVEPATSVIKRILKKVVVIDGEPVETEEVADDPEKFTEETMRKLSSDTSITETVYEPEIIIRKVEEKQVVKKVVMIDGKPTETEVIVEEPESVTEHIFPNVISDISVSEFCEPEITTSRQIIRKRIIKKILMVNGEPVETEEVVEEPEDVTAEIMQNISLECGFANTVCESGVKTTHVRGESEPKKSVDVDSKYIETEFTGKPSDITKEELERPTSPVITETVCEPELIATESIQRKNIIKRVVTVDGKPVETGEVVEDPDIIARDSMDIAQESANIETIIDPEGTTTNRLIKKRIIKKTIVVNGKPVESEEIIEEPRDTTEDSILHIPAESIISEALSKPELSSTRRVIRKRIIKKVTMADGKPLETEEIIEEPEDITKEIFNIPTEAIITETISEPNVTTIRKVIRKRIIKKTIMVDGKPVEVEEVVEVPEEIKQEVQFNIPPDSETIEDGIPVETEEGVENPVCVTKDMSTIPTESVAGENIGQLRRVIKKITMVDGKPVESEEVMELGSENMPTGFTVIEAESKPETTIIRRVIRKKIIKKIIIVDGEPTEIEEVIEEPTDVLDEMSNILPDSVISEVVTEPEVTSIRRIIRKRIIKRITIVNGKPIETEEIVEEPEDITDEVVETIPEKSLFEARVSGPEISVSRRIIKKRIIKKIVIVDGKPVETEEIVEEPEDVEHEITNISGESSINEATSPPKISTIIKDVRKGISKKILKIDGEPIVTEVLEEPDITKDEILTVPIEPVITETVIKPETVLRTLTKTRITKKIHMVDGKTVETEEVVEEPDVTEEGIVDISRESVIHGSVMADCQPLEKEEIPEKTIDITEGHLPVVPEDVGSLETLIKPDNSSVNMEDGESVELEEVVKESVAMSEMRESLETIGKITDETVIPPSYSVTSETTSNPEEDSTENTIGNKVVKRIIMEDSKPVETEETVEESVAMEDIQGNIPVNDAVITENPEQNVISESPDIEPISSSGIRIIKKNVKIRRLVRIVDDKEIVEEEQSESPDEIFEYPQSSLHDTQITLPISESIENVQIGMPDESHEIPFQQARVIRQIRIEDGKPIFSEEILEEDNALADQGPYSEVTRVQVRAVRRRMKIIKRVQIINGERVETEEVVEEPETHFDMPDDEPEIAVTEICHQNVVEEVMETEDDNSPYSVPVSGINDSPMPESTSNLINEVAQQTSESDKIFSLEPQQLVSSLHDEEVTGDFPVPEGSTSQPMGNDYCEPKSIQNESPNIWKHEMYYKDYKETTEYKDISPLSDENLYASNELPMSSPLYDKEVVREFPLPEDQITQPKRTDTDEPKPNEAESVNIWTDELYENIKMRSERTTISEPSGISTVTDGKLYSETEIPMSTPKYVEDNENQFPLPECSVAQPEKLYQDEPKSTKDESGIVWTEALYGKYTAETCAESKIITPVMNEKVISTESLPMSPPRYNNEVISEFPVPEGSVIQPEKNENDDPKGTECMSVNIWAEELYNKTENESAETIAKPGITDIAPVPDNKLIITSPLPMSLPQHGEVFGDFPLPGGSIAQPESIDNDVPERNDDGSENVWKERLYNKHDTQPTDSSYIPESLEAAPCAIIPQVQTKEAESDMQPFPIVAEPVIDVTREILYLQDKATEATDLCRETKNIESFPLPRELAVQDKCESQVMPSVLLLESTPFPEPQVKNSGLDQLCK
ncbi:hypothetical protein SK128_028536, partial [Halocaridina rubra]